MKIVRSPEEYLVGTGEIPCFMAGGLQKCDWHSEFLAELAKMNPSHLVIYDPKRLVFDINDTKATRDQIQWEFKYLNAFLNRPYIFSMYFDHSESVQPICFYELGRYLALASFHDSLGSCVVSVHPEFSRKDDVLIQTDLATQGDVRVAQCSPADHANRVYSMYMEVKHMMI